MFWQKSRKESLAEAKRLEQRQVVTDREFLDQVHQEAENVERLKALLTDVRKLKDSALPRKKQNPTRKTKSSSRKRR
jgi:hypothetical protein